MHISTRHLTAAIPVSACVLLAGGAFLSGCGGSTTNTTGNLPLPSGIISTPFPVSTPMTNPMPNPTPSPSPSGGVSGTTLGTYYTGFATTASDTFAFQFTNTITLNPDPNGNSNTQTGTYTVRGPLDIFGAPNGGQKTTVTINLPVSGNRVVTRQEVVDSNGKVFSYIYYTEDSNGRTQYGSDDLSTGRVSFSTRTEGGPVIPYTLMPGQSRTTNFTNYVTEFDPNGNITQQYNYAQQDTITFVGLETVTVPAGTYSNVAHTRVNSTFDQNNTTADLFVSPFVGPIRSVDRSIAQNLTDFDRDHSGNLFTYTSTFDSTSELVSATVNGTNYPPGRSVAPPAASGSKSSPFRLFAPHHTPKARHAKR